MQGFGLFRICQSHFKVQLIIYRIITSALENHYKCFGEVLQVLWRSITEALERCCKPLSTSLNLVLN